MSGHTISGGAGDYWVTPAQLEEAASRTMLTSQNVQDKLMNMHTYIMGLESFWTGSAHQQFLELMNDWNIYSKMLGDALTDIAAGLLGNKVNYEEAEKANMRNLVQVHLPPARF